MKRVARRLLILNNDDLHHGFLRASLKSPVPSTEFDFSSAAKFSPGHGEREIQEYVLGQALAKVLDEHVFEKISCFGWDWAINLLSRALPGKKSIPEIDLYVDPSDVLFFEKTKRADKKTLKFISELAGVYSSFKTDQDWFQKRGFKGRFEILKWNELQPQPKPAPSKLRPLRRVLIHGQNGIWDRPLTALKGIEDSRSDLSGVRFSILNGDPILMTKAELMKGPDFEFDSVSAATPKEFEKVARNFDCFINLSVARGLTLLDQTCRGLGQHLVTSLEVNPDEPAEVARHLRVLVKVHSDVF